MKIAVIGCGGTGSYLLPVLLRSLGPRDQLVLVDGDKFDESNLDRQVFEASKVGVNKAVALADMYKEHASITPRPAYLEDVDELQGFDLVFACPDNHIARTVVLEAADKYGFPAIVCGNEYESAAAMLYLKYMKGTTEDPRIRYPEILTDRSGSPLHVSCTGEATKAAPQLAIANNMSAAFAVALMYYALKCWPGEDFEGTREYIPLEFGWVPSRLSTINQRGLKNDESRKTQQANP